MSCLPLTPQPFTFILILLVITNKSHLIIKESPILSLLWFDNIEPNAPSRAASSTTCTSPMLPPSLTAGSPHSSDSVNTNAIQVTQNTQVAATNIKKEYTCIEVEDNGTLSDYNETTGKEEEKALTSPFNNGVHATSSVIHSYIYWLNLVPPFTRIWSPKTGQSLSQLPRLQSLLSNLTSLMGSTMKFSTVLSFLLLLPTILARMTHRTTPSPSCAMRSTLFWGQQVEWTSKLILKGPSIRMYVW